MLATFSFLQPPPRANRSRGAMTACAVLLIAPTDLLGKRARHKYSH